MKNGVPDANDLPRPADTRSIGTNSEAADLPISPIEESEELRRANALLGRVNAEAAELVAELEERGEQLRSSNTMLAQANARSAELVAELQARREELEWTNTNLKQANEDKKRILGIAAHDLRSGIGGSGVSPRSSAARWWELPKRRASRPG